MGTCDFFLGCFAARWLRNDFSKGDSEVKIQSPNAPDHLFFFAPALRALNHNVIVEYICLKYFKGSIHKGK